MTRRLLLLNGLAVLAVALHHASGFGFQAMFDWTDQYMAVSVPNYDQVGSWQFWGIVFTQQIDNFALPAFMFVSGFFAAFMARGKEGNMTWSVVWGRIRGLLIPFTIWTIIFFLFFMRRLPRSLDELFDRYYYVLLLSQYYVLSPFLLPWAKKHGRLLLGIAAVITLSWHGVRYWMAFDAGIPALKTIITLTPKWIIPNLFFWFILGIYIGFNRQETAIWLKKYKRHLFVAWISLGLLTVIDYRMVFNLTGRHWLGPYFGGMSRPFYSLIFMLTFLAFDEVKLPFSKQLADLGSKSLGVYLVHARAMFIVAVLMYKFAPALLGIQLIYQLILIVTGLSGSLLLMKLVRQSPAQKYYRYLFG